MSPLLIADVRFAIQPDAEAAFMEAIGPFLAASRAVEGNLDFQVLREVGEPTRIVLLERWASRAAFEAYLASDAFAAFRTTVGPLLAGPPDSVTYEASLSDRAGVR